MGLSTLIGGMEKAIIKVIDMRETEIAREAPVIAKGGPGIGPLNADGIALPEIPDIPILEVVSSMLSGMGSEYKPPQGSKIRTFTVQFNPNELSISAAGGGMVNKKSFDATGNATITHEPASATMHMDVNLIFDKVDPQDAFMADKFNLSPTAIGTGIAKAIMRKDYSVRPEVEGFMALLRSPYTSRVMFCWGKLMYVGVVTSVSAQYTMFNTDGDPIRAKVKMSMVLADERIANDTMGVWQKHYTDAFDKNSSFKSLGSKVGNLINL